MVKKKYRISFQVTICVEADADGFYAYCPTLKGVHVGGATEAEAIESAKEASILYIKSLIKHAST